MYQKNSDVLTRMAIPVYFNEGLQSEVSNHFGKAPGFIVVNSDGSQAVHLEAQSIREHGECAPIRGLVEAGAKLVFAKGMGRGAMQRCHDHGLIILEAMGDRVADVLHAFMLDRCNDFPDAALCDHHEHPSCGGDHHH